MVGSRHFDPFSVDFGHQRIKIGPRWPQSESLLNTHPKSVHHKFEVDCVKTFWNNGQKPMFWPIFSHLWATRGPKFDPRGLKANQFWTLTQQMHRPNLKVIEWLLFQIRDPILVKRELNMLCNLLINQLSSGYLKSFKKSGKLSRDRDLIVMKLKLDVCHLPDIYI